MILVKNLELNFDLMAANPFDTLAETVAILSFSTDKMTSYVGLSVAL